VNVSAATYRLQCNRELDFDRIRGLVPFLERLGISDIYLAPITAAGPGSDHGYDVIDPTRIDSKLGGEAGFLALVDELAAHGMHLVLDFVPNHMLATIENPWWADQLANGRDSACAHIFDIDWTDDGKVVLPVLARPLAEAIAAGEVRLDAGDNVLRYHDHAFPLAPGTDASDVARALAHQHYELEHWRQDAARRNYRRFFEVDHLAGVRQEDERVFEETHALIRRLAASDAVSAVRIDHIDGLLDPAQYLDRLERLAPDRGILVEKILAGDEQLPAAWPVDGTTGYEFLNAVNGLFVDPAGLAQLQRGYTSFTGRDASFADMAFESKRQVARELFPAELRQLSDDLAPLVPDETRGALTRSLIDLAAAFPVYRTYVDADGVPEHDRVTVVEATAEARRRGHGSEALDALERVLLLDVDLAQRDAAMRCVQRWQQFTGPIAAKGLEDTALYRYNALVSMNEVGADPKGPSATNVAAFHDFNRGRLAKPYTLNATSTHDTKRGEDVRARLNVLSELAGEWGDRQSRWHELTRDLKTAVHGEPAPTPNDETLIYQTLVGAWPVDDVDLPAFRQRLHDYFRKTAREAKERTSWLDPDDAYESALTGFANALFDHAAFLEDFRPFQERVAELAVTNSLAQVVLKVASPGMPDVYQGTELWDLNLVDPDNRRPVDFAKRERTLADLAQSEARPAVLRELLEGWPDARVKLWVLSRALAFRRHHEALFTEGEYLPLETTGALADCVVAFARRNGDQWAVAAVPRLTAPLGYPPLGEVWEDTAIRLPSDATVPWRNVLTEEDLNVEAGAIAAAALFARLPVALLSA